MGLSLALPTSSNGSKICRVTFSIQMGSLHVLLWLLEFILMLRGKPAIPSVTSNSSNSFQSMHCIIRVDVLAFF